MKFKTDVREEKQVASQQRIKEGNLTLIFNLIKSKDIISRSELAQITKLSPTTISSLVDELLRNNMVVEIGAGTTTTSGRKPIMLEVNPYGGYVAAVEMLKDSFRCYLYDLNCKPVGGGKYEVKDYVSFGGQVISKVDELLESHSIGKKSLLGIGIGIPGLIDYEKNRVLSSTVLAIEPDNDFYDQIKAYYCGIPVFLQNESCFYAYAEKEYGQLKDVRNLVFIDINVGIGAGIVLNGQIFSGSFGTAGEIGHMTIDMKGPKCVCGNRGCLEVMASVPAILQKVVFAVMAGRNTIVNDLVKNDYNGVNLEVISEALKKGDTLISEIVDETADALAYGINNIINLFSPEVIAIGGELTKLGDGLLDRVKARLCNIGLLNNINKVRIKYSVLGEDAVTLGGAKYSLDRLFEIK